uniref:Conserved secreted protein n=1 Tax=Rhabditophanes sp. KR3021 TaxID=114890 RepID=A0AC35TWJ4_9BILA
MVKFILLLALIVSVYCHPADVGLCRQSVGPMSWLWTKASGILGYASAGVPLTGPNYCVQFNQTETDFAVQYHIDIGADGDSKKVHVEHGSVKNLNNGCINQDEHIHYCFPMCVNYTLQDIATKNFLLYRTPHQVAQGIYKDMEMTDGWAVTVIKVDLNANPQAKLTQDVFLIENYCSVYIGNLTTSY